MIPITTIETKYLYPDGIGLLYAEVNADQGPTIFFFHGNSSSHATWQASLANPALSDYRLVAFDLPAHGSSDPASVITNNYSLPGIGALMTKAVLELSNGHPFILAGSSLGTNIIAEMLADSLHPAGILLEGPCILGREYTPASIMRPDTCIGMGFVDDLTEDDMACLGKMVSRSTDESLHRQIASDMRMVKDHFRSHCGNSLAAGLLNDQVALIKKRSIPVLVIFGDPDPAIYEDYLDGAELALWKNKVVKLPGAGHWAHLDEPEQFTNLLKDFAGEVLAPADLSSKDLTQVGS